MISWGEMEEDLVVEMRKAFEKVQAELGFKAGWEELDKIFFIEDAVLGAGYVSKRFSRQICSRIVETYMNWDNYLHGLVIPNPQNMINITESKMFDHDEKKQIMKLMTKTMKLVSSNTLVGLTKEKKKEAGFIDEAVRFWNEEFEPKAKEVMKKVNEKWKERVDEGNK